MQKKSMHSALSASLKAEDESVQSRFDKADSLLSEKESKTVRTTKKAKKEIKPKPVKKKLIRDSFTLPEDDYALIEDVQQRCFSLSKSINKSEVIRAGLHALMHLSDDEFAEILKTVEKLKPGRRSST